MTLVVGPLQLWGNTIVQQMQFRLDSGELECCTPQRYDLHRLGSAGLALFPSFPSHTPAHLYGN